MNQPAKHFHPQKRSDQLRVVNAIKAVEQAMLPTDFDAAAVSMQAMHFQSDTNAITHEAASIRRLQDQVDRADTKRRLAAMAQLPLAPLDQQHIAVIRQHQAKRFNTNTLATPPEATESFTRRASNGYSRTTPKERFWLGIVVGVYLGAIVATVAVVTAFNS